MADESSKRLNRLRPTSKLLTDWDILAENHQFVMEPKEAGEDDPTWEKRMLRAYYDRLFKEYALTDFSKLPTATIDPPVPTNASQLPLRWRTEAEVKTGKGQAICGNLPCQERDDLTSWELNFAYVEQGIHKNTLVKLRLCERCSLKLPPTTKKAKNIE